MSAPTDHELQGRGEPRQSYRGWHIHYDPPPIPVRNCDWQFWHDDYDGAPDAGDNRCGYAESLEAAKAEIDEREFDRCRCSSADPLECMALTCEHRDIARAAIKSATGGDRG